MSNTSGRRHHGIFSRKLEESEKIASLNLVDSSEMGQQQAQPESAEDDSWSRLWGDNVCNRNEHEKRKKKRSQKDKTVKRGKPIYPIGPMFESMPIDGEEDEGGGLNLNGNNKNNIPNNDRNSNNPSPFINSNNEFVSSTNPNPPILQSIKPNAQFGSNHSLIFDDDGIGLEPTRTNGMANSTENCSSISGGRFHWSETSSASAFPKIHGFNPFVIQSNTDGTNQNKRWRDSGSPHPPVSHYHRSTLFRTLPHNLGTNLLIAAGNNGNCFGRIRTEYQYSDSTDPGDDEENLLSNVQNGDILGAFVNPNPEQPNSSIPRNQQKQNVQRGDSILSLETANSGTTNSSFTIQTDEHIAQYVQQRQSIFDEIDYENETTGLEHLLENNQQQHPSIRPSSQSSSSITPTPQSCNASIQTENTLTEPQIPLHLPRRPPFNPLLLANEQQTFQILAQKMGLQFEFRQELGAIYFSKPEYNQILVLNSKLYKGENDKFQEVIRVSLHENGRICRETNLMPVEKWLGLAAIEGLCRRFFH